MAPITANDDSRDLSSDLGATIRELREEAGVSQEKFAELTGHHRTYIGFLERGERTPNVYTVYRVATALRMSLSDLLKRAGY
ncbi:MAG: helix-turn-helix transcriptional regulator [Akkermansiaceae bacterium]